MSRRKTPLPTDQESLQPRTKMPVDVQKHPLGSYSFFKQAFKCKCPRCNAGTLFKKGFTLNLNEKCTACGLDFAENDSADGPAVFLIFVLGFLVVPLALFVEFRFHPPLLFHVIFWSALTIGLTVLTLKPLKSLVIAIQYYTQPKSWNKSDSESH